MSNNTDAPFPLAGTLLKGYRSARQQIELHDSDPERVHWTSPLLEEFVCAGERVVSDHWNIESPAETRERAFHLLALADIADRQGADDA